MSRGGTAIVLLGTVVLLVVGQLTLRPAILGQRDSWGEPDEVFAVPDRGVARIMSAGYNEFFAAMIWVRLQVYAGSSDSNADRGYGEMARMLKAIIALDPYFRFVYEFAAYSMTHRSKDGAPTQDEYRETIWYLEEGLKSFPEDVVFREILATRYAVNLKPKDSDDRDRNLEKAIAYLEQAMELPMADIREYTARADDYRSRLSDGNPLGETQERLEACLRRMMSESSEAQRQRIQRRCERISSKAAKLLANSSEIFDRWRAETPYEWTPDMAVLLGKPQQKWSLGGNE